MVTPTITFPIWPGDIPGSESWHQQEIDELSSEGQRRVRNVTRPTLSAFLPEPEKANGTAVIICPGGGFHFQLIDQEGFEVARWFQERGVAAFVLKYRLKETAAGIELFEKDFWAVLSKGSKSPQFRAIVDPIIPLAVADGLQAVKMVRQKASEYNISPDKVGIMGFSAGGRITVGAILEYKGEESRPNFAAPIYGALWDDLNVPADAPPVFIAVANDDETAIVECCLNLYSGWKKAQKPVELHIYSEGGHGFGMRKQGLPIDGWIDRLGDWLKVQGFL